MNLSSDLVSQFAKSTNDSEKKTTDNIVYGTVIKDEDKIYVKLDGSDLITPLSTSTAAVKSGDTVAVMIKNHKAIAIGSTSNQSTGIAEYEIVDGKLNSIIIDADKLDAAVAYIQDLVAEDVKITGRLDAHDAAFENLDSSYANIDFSNIGKAAMEYFYSTSGLIKDVTIGDSTITGNLVGVTISGDLLKANTVIADKLVIKGEDGILYKLNTDGLKAIDDTENCFLNAYRYAEENVTNVEWHDDCSATVTMGATELTAYHFELRPDRTYVISYTGENCGLDIFGEDWSTICTIERDSVNEMIIAGAKYCYFVGIDRENQTTYSFRNVRILDKDAYDVNRLDGSIIAAKSITATKVSVEDLVAFDATIGGFNITDKSIYSGVKESIDNGTRGIYFNRDGEFVVGDSRSFMKYYRDPEGNYHLAISADSIEFSGNQSMIGGRNLYLGTRNFDGDKWVNIHEWETWDDEGFGYREYGRYGTWLGLGQYVEVKAGETYTFSFYAKGNQNAEITIYTAQDHTETTPGSLYIGPIPDEYIRYHFTFTVNQDCTIYPRVENMTDDGWIQIYGLKFERGSVATDWSPAPEDAENSINDAAKTATDFMQYDSANGLQLGNKTTGSWSGFRAQITSVAYNILNEAGVALASYGASLIELGKNSVNAVIKLCGGMGEIKYNSDENYLDISSDSIRLKGTEMSSVEAGYTNSSGVQRNSAVHASPTEVQIRSGINSSGSWNDCSIRVTPDDIQTSGFIYDNDTGGYYESFEEGTSGIWTYRKWKNGKVELWGERYVSTMSCSAALGNWYRTTSLTIGNFPFTVYNPKLVANYESTGYGGLLWPTTSTTTSSPPEYYLIRPTSGNVTGTIYIHVVGEWTN